MIERMELGEFYKELRLARKLKQSDVACDGLTASQLSKFELGQSMLSADKLILAIQGINMNFDEFGHKLNNYQESPHMRIGRRVVDRFAIKILLVWSNCWRKSSKNRWRRPIVV